jgi:hypothetical protein
MMNAKYAIYVMLCHPGNAKIVYIDDVEGRVS